MDFTRVLLLGACLAGAFAALYGLHRLALHLEDKGRLYYLRKKPEGTSPSLPWPNCSAYSPGHKHVLTIKEQKQGKSEKDKQGDEPPLAPGGPRCRDFSILFVFRFLVLLDILNNSPFPRFRLGVSRTVKRIPVLPTLLTLANGVCGLAAIAYASKVRLDPGLSAESDRYFLIAAFLILVGMVFDVLDGYAARVSQRGDFGGGSSIVCAMRSRSGPPRRFFCSAWDRNGTNGPSSVVPSR